MIRPSRDLPLPSTTDHTFERLTSQVNYGVFSIRRISIRRIPIIGLGLGLGIGLGLGLGLGIAFGELKFGELKRNR